MNVASLQPPYPHLGTKEAAQNCIDWMKFELKKMADKKIDLILLPEYSNCPGIEKKDILNSFIDNEGNEFCKILQTYALNLKCPILAGIAAKNINGDLKNRIAFFSPDGEVVYNYDKLHLTQAEIDLGVIPGDKVGIFEWNGLKLGFVICFDIYFPEYISSLTAAKVDMIIYSSYQRGENIETIQAMTSSRALDSGAWILRSSYSIAPDSPTGGCSMIVAPDGKIQANIKSRPGVLIENFNPNQKYRKAASYGKAETEYWELLESKRRPGAYRTTFEKIREYTSTSYPRICAHRGLSFSMPENTIPSFAAAIAAGAHEIEFDLWLSEDGVPVVCHDPDLNRVAGTDLIITKSSWGNIRKVDLGITKSKEFSGIGIPRLEDVLALADGSFGMNIHIKDPGKDGKLVKIVADMIKKRCLTDCAYIAGEEDVLEVAMAVAPNITRACLAYQDKPDDMVKAAIKYECGIVQFGRNFTSSHTALMKEVGIINNLFYSDNYDEALNYIDNGIDVILSNVAQLLIAKSKSQEPIAKVRKKELI